MTSNGMSSIEVVGVKISFTADAILSITGCVRDAFYTALHFHYCMHGCVPFPSSHSSWMARYIHLSIFCNRSLFFSFCSLQVSSVFIFILSYFLFFHRNFLQTLYPFFFLIPIFSLHFISYFFSTQSNELVVNMQGKSVQLCRFEKNKYIYCDHCAPRVCVESIPNSA